MPKSKAQPMYPVEDPDSGEIKDIVNLPNPKIVIIVLMITVKFFIIVVGHMVKVILFVCTAVVQNP